MTTNTTTALRALARHMDLHELDDGSIMRAGLDHSDRLEVQIYAGQTGDMRALLARWADTIDEAAVTAEPVQDSFHVHVTGTISGFQITVVCVASGQRADQLRAALGVPVVPVLPTGDTLLDALAPQPAAVA